MHHASQPSEARRVLAQSITCPALSALPGIRHGFFTRNGGASDGIYASLNCALSTGDAPEAVAENYRRIAGALGVADSYLCKAYQVHGATAITVEKPWPRGQAPQADALVTNIPGIALGVTTADCLPILLADSKHRVIASVHAGWKGTLGGVIEAALAAMQALGAKPADTHVAIGPSIAQESYEVSGEFYERFLAEDEGNKQYFIAGPRAGHRLFDLKTYAKDRLRDAGVNHIIILPHDTCAEEADFFSYRRSCLRKEAGYGCQLSAIVME